MGGDIYQIFTRHIKKFKLNIYTPNYNFNQVFIGLKLASSLYKNWQSCKTDNKGIKLNKKFL